jgi:hypothetical protein
MYGAISSATPSHPACLQVDEEEAAAMTLSSAADRALQQLDDVVASSMDLAERLDDPTSPEMLAADRLVAAAAQRATALTRALDAAVTMQQISSMTAAAQQAQRRRPGPKGK